MKPIATFLMIMTICGSAFGAAVDLYKEQIIAPADKTRVNIPQHLNQHLPQQTYTIDKRKYVSRDTAPFSAVVGLYHPGQPNYCSGTLTTDGIIITAKHCIVNKGNNAYIPLTQIHINYKNDSNVAVNHGLSPTADIWNSDGSHSYNNANAPLNDWAFLVPKKDIKSTINVNKITPNTTASVVVAGYGALKILSDQEIHKIRTEYAKWLNNLNGQGYHENTRTGTDLNISSSTGHEFLLQIHLGLISGVAADTFKDTNKLKASYCRATANDTRANEIGCQIWGGNSGGSVFFKYKDKWYLYGVTVSGKKDITNNRSTYAQGVHMVPINKFFTHYRNIVSQLKKGNPNEK